MYRSRTYIFSCSTHVTSVHNSYFVLNRNKESIFLPFGHLRKALKNCNKFNTINRFIKKYHFNTAKKDQMSSLIYLINFVSN